MRRFALAAATALLASSVLAGCAEDETTSTPATQVIEVEFVGGEVLPEPSKVKVTLGTEVTVEVTSDVAEQLHVHAYDHVVEVGPGQSDVVTFIADTPGLFEAEMENSGIVAFEMEVS